MWRLPASKLREMLHPNHSPTTLQPKTHPCAGGLAGEPVELRRLANASLCDILHSLSSEGHTDRDKRWHQSNKTNTCITYMILVKLPNLVCYFSKGEEKKKKKNFSSNQKAGSLHFSVCRDEISVPQLIPTSLEQLKLHLFSLE